MCFQRLQTCDYNARDHERREKKTYVGLRCGTGAYGGLYLFNLEYLGRYQTEGKRFEYDVAGRIYEEGLSPEAIRGKPREDVPVVHDF